MQPTNPTPDGEARPPRPGRRIWLMALVPVVALAVALLTGVIHDAARAPDANGPPSLQSCLRALHRPCLGPAEIRAYYGLDALYRRGITGRGQTIAIVVSFGSPSIRADLHRFDRAFGLPDPELRILTPLGKPRPRSGGWISETTLDVEWAHAIAPEARLVLLVSPVDETEGVQGMPEFLSLERYVVQHHLANVISQSWSATEDTLFDRRGRAIVQQFHRFYQRADAQGITALAASGDDGAAGPDLSVTHLFPYRVVGYPASDPYVLAVGGTYIPAGSGGRLLGETTWSGSGGGISKFFAEPAYQRSLPAATQRLLRGYRGLPDVAYNAAPESPVLVWQQGHWVTGAGTSAATPQWAGLVALADQLAGRGLGSINAALYRLAASPRYGAVLRDITTGGIAAPSGDPRGLHGIAFRAGPGWDPATGLGSPRAASLVPDLVNDLAAHRSPSHRLPSG